MCPFLKLVEIASPVAPAPSRRYRQWTWNCSASGECGRFRGTSKTGSTYVLGGGEMVAEQRSTYEAQKAKARRNFWTVVGVLGLITALHRPLFGHGG